MPVSLPVEFPIDAGALVEQVTVTAVEFGCVVEGASPETTASRPVL